MKDKKAFTLAEVLITLTIIGVIAAITIPNLMKKYENHNNYTAFMKSYSVINNAYKLLVNEQGTDWITNTKSNNNIAELMAEKMEQYLKIEKKCNKVPGCWNTPKQLNGNSVWGGYQPLPTTALTYKLSDGSNIAYWRNITSSQAPWLWGQSVGNSTYAYQKINIYVDVNGNKGPNKLGRDVFIFYIECSTPEKLRLSGDAGYLKYCNPVEKPSDAFTGPQCAYKIFKERGMHY